MNLSNKGLEFIKKEEGLRLQAYPDGVNVWTIGYGHTKNVTPDMTISKELAEKLLLDDVKFFVDGVNKYTIQKGISLTQGQFDALVSLCFNVGLGSIFTKDYGNSFGKGSTLYYHLKQGDYQKASERFLDFKKAGGVTISALYERRQREQAMFNYSNENSLEQKKNNLSLLWFFFAIILIKPIITNGK